MTCVMMDANQMSKLTHVIDFCDFDVFKPATRVTIARYKKLFIRDISCHVLPDIKLVLYPKTERNLDVRDDVTMISSKITHVMQLMGLICFEAVDLF